MLETYKPDFCMATDFNGQAIPALNLKPDSIKSLSEGNTIDCTEKTLLVFENDVQIQLNGLGYYFTLRASKEVCVADLNSITVIGVGNYIII